LYVCTQQDLTYQSLFSEVTVAENRKIIVAHIYKSMQKYSKSYVGLQATGGKAFSHDQTIQLRILTLLLVEEAHCDAVQHSAIFVVR